MRKFEHENKWIVCINLLKHKLWRKIDFIYNLHFDPSLALFQVLYCIRHYFRVQLFFRGFGQVR